MAIAATTHATSTATRPFGSHILTALNDNPGVALQRHLRLVNVLALLVRFGFFGTYFVTSLRLSAP